MGKELALRPSYWASVSGGKDSLYMLKLILENPNKYPLDGVVHFELEIDYPFIKNVIDYMEQECKKHGIKFARIKPRKTWEELYYSPYYNTGHIYGFPTGLVRWCNSEYKLDSKKQLEKFMRSQGFYIVWYIGYCADEEKRFLKRFDKQITEVYPLAENNITENYIWLWAKKVPLFNNYYLTNKRCGCMYCPLMSYIELAYLYKYYRDRFNYLMCKIRETEYEFSKKNVPFSFKNKTAEYIEKIIKSKWLEKLNREEEKELWLQQME